VGEISGVAVAGGAATAVPLGGAAGVVGAVFPQAPATRTTARAIVAQRPLTPSIT
jgi:hypothetical protein